MLSPFHRTILEYKTLHFFPKNLFTTLCSGNFFMVTLVFKLRCKNLPVQLTDHWLPKIKPWADYLTSLSHFWWGGERCTYFIYSLFLREGALIGGNFMFQTWLGLMIKTPCNTKLTLLPMALYSRRRWLNIKRIWVPKIWEGVCIIGGAYIGWCF